MGGGEGLFFPRGLDRSGSLLGAGALGALHHLVRPWPVAAPVRALAGARSLLVVLLIPVLVLVAVGLSARMRPVALGVPRRALDGVLRQQLRMRATLDRPAAGNHDDLVHIYD